MRCLASSQKSGVGDLVDSSERTEKREDEWNQVYATVGETAMDETKYVALLQSAQKQPKMSIFARDFHWTPHVFDSKECFYNILCPHGGPGGLVCCASCTASYTKHLTKTAIDMETQKMQKVGDEVNELIEFTRSAKQTLAHTIKVARRKPVPTRRNTVTRTDPSRPTTTARNASPQVEPVRAQQAPPVVGPWIEFPNTMDSTYV